MIEEISNHLKNLSIEGKPIVLSKTYVTEILILVNGGVTVKDFDKAIEIWLNMKTNVTNDYGFIRNMALKSAAERIEILLEADRG